MAEEKNESWQIPILTRENHETWFRRYKVKLNGKSVFYVVGKSMQDHCKVATVGEITNAFEELDITETDKITVTKVRINIDRKAQYLKDEAIALELMFRALSFDDQALIDEYDTAFTFWAHLKTKYSEIDATAANTYMTMIQTFTFETDSTIIGAWDKLKGYRRKLGAADENARNAYNDSALLLVLIRSLPKEYETTVDTLNAQSSLTVEAKLKHLEAKQIRLQREEQAHPASEVKSKYGSGKYVPPQRRERQDSTSSSGNTTSDYTCYLCDEKHFLRNCPSLKYARKAVQERIQQKAARRSSSRSNKKVHFQRSSSPSPSQVKKSTMKLKAHGLAALQDTEASDYSIESDDEEEECVFLTKESIRKTTPSTWPADTGASSHMSDQRHLFRELRPIPRRRIRVGGGVMYAREKGTANLVCKDGSSMLLQDVLYVPGLGVNLLSARRVCQAGLKGRFGATEMYFKLGKKKVIEATMHEGLYIVTHVAEGYGETAFASIDTNMQDATEEALMQTKPKRERSELTEDQKEVYMLMHRRFNHLEPNKLRNLHKVTTLAKPIKVPAKRDICEVCAITKMTNLIPKLLSEHKAFLLALIQFDIAGPFPTSLRGHRYFMLIIDSWSRMNWILLLKHKSEAPKQLKLWKQEVEHQREEKVLAARSDNAPELIKAVREWREAGSGIRSELTTIASSHQNGPAERNIRTAETNMRAMIKEANLPLEFWDEAAEYDAYVRNRTDTGPVVDGSVVSPQEAFTGETPSIDHCKIWGSKCYSYVNPKTIPTGQRHDKLVNPGRLGIFMGFSNTTTKHTKVYNPELGYTSRCSRVIVDETVKGGTMDLKLRCKPGTQGTPNEAADRAPRGRPEKQPVKLVIQPPTLSKSQPERKVPQVVTPPFVPPENIPRFGFDEDPEELKVESTKDNSTKDKFAIPDLTGEETTKPTVQSTSRQVPQPTMPTSNRTTPQSAPRYFTRGEKAKRKREEDEVVEDERFAKIIRAMLAQVDLTEEEFAFITSTFSSAFPAEEIAGIKIPRTYKEAVNDPKYGKQWINAMREEIISLLENGTFKEVVPPEASNLVSSKWVYTIKLNADGIIERFKARLVARGFSQVRGTDYNETFAPTVRMDTLRLFLAAAAAEDLECAQFDIKNAFTESHLKEAIYLSPPKGLDVKKGCALQVMRSLYGLKQSARDWNLLIKKELLAWGFVQSKADPCMFIHEERGLRLLVYVDDIVAAAKQQSQINWFHEKLSDRFNTKNLGEIQKILGVRVTRDRKNRTIYLDQEQYLRTVLDKFGIKQKTHKDKKIPVADYTSFRPAADDDTRIDVTEYQAGIGSLMFAMVLTRPDIAFVLGKLAQYMSDPAEHHGHALKNLFRYLNSTITQKLRYGPGGVHKNFTVYSDADWAGDKVDRKSVSGSVAMFYGGPISWSSKKQRSVATSSCESEYLALSTCAKQGQWIAQVFRDMGRSNYIGKDTNKIQMLGDNQGAIALVKNPHLHERSKHIDICYHFVRDLAEQGKLEVTYIPTFDMVADGMTKPLQRVAFEKFKGQLGVTAG